jgi:hypothetical protein
MLRDMIFKKDSEHLRISKELESVKNEKNSTIKYIDVLFIIFNDVE